MARWHLFVLAAVMATACGGNGGSDDTTPADADTVDAAGDAAPDTASDSAEIGADTLPDVPPLPFVRAALLAEGDEGITGPNAAWLPGDYLLENSRARFVIQGDNPARTWIPWPGSLIDADVARAPGEQGHDNLGELSIVTGILRSMKPTAWEVVNDGADGQPAHLRVSGPDIGVPIVDTVIPLPPFGYQVAVDYVLEPDDNALQITTTVTASKTRKADLGDALLPGDRVRPLFAGFEAGPVKPVITDPVPFYLMVARDVAYGVAPVEGPGLKAPVGEGDVIALVGLGQNVPAGQSASYTRLFVVGATLEEVRARLAEQQGQERHDVVVNVTLDDPQDAAEPAEVVVYDKDQNPVSQAWLPAETVTFSLPPGDYGVAVRQIGRPALEPVLVQVPSDTEVTVHVPATGRIATAIDGDDYVYQHRDGLPCRVSVQAGADADLRAGVLRRVYPGADGKLTFLIEPGSYTLTAARGYEYEYARGNVTVAAGETAPFAGTLVRSVHTEGWVNADFHMHSEGSADATIPIELRLHSLASVGLERLPITDHDTITDADALLAPLGLDEWLRLTAGVEVSPVGKHTNAFPVVKDPAASTYYGTDISWGYDEAGVFQGAKTFPEIWTMMREQFQAGLLQINHPRDGQGYFDVIQYDPAKGTGAIKPGLFSTEFDTVELINGGDVTTSQEKVLADWYGFLHEGIVKTGVSVSDSHVDSNAGDGRSYVRVGTDAPRDVTDADLVAAVKGGHVIAATGPFLDVTIGDAGPGDTVQTAGTVDVNVRVWAPSWMPVDWIRVVKNGDPITEQAVSGTDPLRYDGAFPVEVAPGDWIVVLAGAPDKDMAPVSPGQRVLSIANPIHVAP
jgi:hypothetical protein